MEYTVSELFTNWFQLDTQWDDSNQILITPGVDAEMVELVISIPPDTASQVTQALDTEVEWNLFHPRSNNADEAIIARGKVVGMNPGDSVINPIHGGGVGYMRPIMFRARTLAGSSALPANALITLRFQKDG